jgi:hypothetical protein
MKAALQFAPQAPATATILPLAQVRPSDRQVGGDALALARLARLALPVPPAIVLRQGFWLSYLAFYGAEALWPSFVARPDEAHAAPLRRLLDESPVPIEQIIRLREALALHVARPWLAQQSATLHEELRYALRPAFGGEADSFASQVGLGPHEFDPALRASWRGAFAPQALDSYARSGAPASLSLLIHVIPTLDSAGSLLTQALEDSDALLVQAVWGMAEPLARASAPADRWLLARRGGAVLRHERGERRSASWPAPGGVVERPLEGNPPAPLGDEQLGALRRLGLRIERVLGAPQELAWTHDGARFWIVQTIAKPSLLPRGSEGWGARAYRSLRSMISRTARS